MGANSTEKRSGDSSTSDAGEASDTTVDRSTASMGQSEGSRIDRRTPMSTDRRLRRVSPHHVHRHSEDTQTRTASSTKKVTTSSEYAKTRRSRGSGPIGGTTRASQGQTDSSHYLSRKPREQENAADGTDSSETSGNTGSTVRRHSTGGRYPSGGTLQGTTETIVRQAVSGPGNSLGSRMPDIKHKAEATTGTPLDDVSVHEGQQVDRACKQIGAVGFTKGSNVALARTADDETVAHELGHVAQQRNGRISRQTADVHRQFMPPEERPGYDPPDQDTSNTEQNTSSSDQQHSGSSSEGSDRQPATPMNPFPDNEQQRDSQRSTQESQSSSESSNSSQPSLEGPAWQNPGSYTIVIRGGMEGLTRGKTVPKRKTLQSIARDNDVHMRALELYNGIQNPNSPGKVIYIPQNDQVIEQLYTEVARQYGQTLETDTYARETKSEDGFLGMGGTEPEGLGDISEKTGVPVDVLAAFNGLTGDQRHSPPEVLDIPVNLTIGDGHEQSHGTPGVREMMTPSTSEKASVEGPPWSPPGEWDFVDRGRTKSQQKGQTLGKIARQNDIHWRALQLYNKIENANDPPRIVYIPKDEGVIAGLYVQMIDRFDDIQTITIDRGKRGLAQIAKQTRQSQNIYVPWKAISRLNNIENTHAPEKERLQIIVDATKPTPDLAPQETSSGSQTERGVTGRPTEPMTDGETPEERKQRRKRQQRRAQQQGEPLGFLPDWVREGLQDMATSGAGHGPAGMGPPINPETELDSAMDDTKRSTGELLKDIGLNTAKVSKVVGNQMGPCSANYAGKVPSQAKQAPVDEKNCGHCETFENIDHAEFCELVEVVGAGFGIAVIWSQTWPIVAGAVGTTLLQVGPCTLLIENNEVEFAKKRDEARDDAKIYECNFVNINLEACSTEDGLRFKAIPNDYECSGRYTEGPYQVKPGDTLGQIAAAHDVSVEALAKHNDIENPGYIKAGDKLEIPEDTPEPTVNVPAEKSTEQDADSNKFDALQDLFVEVLGNPDKIQRVLFPERSSDSDTPARHQTGGQYGDVPWGKTESTEEDESQSRRQMGPPGSYYGGNDEWAKPKSQAETVCETFENIDVEDLCELATFVRESTIAVLLGISAAKRGRTGRLSTLKQIEKGGNPVAVGSIMVQLGPCDMFMAGAEEGFSENLKEDLPKGTTLSCEFERFDLEVCNEADGGLQLVPIPREEGGYECDRYDGPTPQNDETDGDKSLIQQQLDNAGASANLINALLRLESGKQTERVCETIEEFPVEGLCQFLKRAVDVGTIGLFFSQGAKPLTLGLAAADITGCEVLVDLAEQDQSVELQEGGFDNAREEFLPEDADPDEKPEITCSFKGGIDLRACVESNQIATFDLLVDRDDLQCRNIVETSRDDGKREPTEYTVQSGDTLWKIALEHDVDPETIYEHNKEAIQAQGDDKNTIYPGMTLTIPAAR